MSGFDYYEFQAIDRPLTKEEVNKVDGLSSRSRVNSRRAVFTYNYGSFKGDSDELLASHFDAYLYMSNYGSRHLEFRIPTRLFNAKALCLYEYEDAVETESFANYTIVKMHYNDEEGGRWLEEDECTNMLDNLLPIRESLMNGDPRALYLTLLANKDNLCFSEDYGEEDKNEDETDSVEEGGRYLESLPIPPNLKNLDSSLESLIDFFEIPHEIIQEFAAKSLDLKKPSLSLPKMVALLSDLPSSEKDAFLLRVLQGDALVAVELKRKLQERAA